MRICLVSKEYPPAGTGGIAAYVYHLAHGLAASGHDVTVIAGLGRPRRPISCAPFDQERILTRPAAERGAVEKSGQTLQDGRQPLRSAPIPGGGTSGAGRNTVHLYRLQTPVPGNGRVRWGCGLWNVLERSRSVDCTVARLERTQGAFDVVEMPNWGAEAFFYSLHPRAPLVIRLSTPLAQVNRFRKNPSTRLGIRLLCYLEALPARRAACIIAHSQFIVDFCAELYRIPAAKASLIPLGIPVPPAPPTKIATDDKAVTILYVGRLERRKGIDRLLQAIPKVIRSAPRCKFVIAGADMGDAPQGGTYREYFASFATPAALQATTFPGYVEEGPLSQLYTDCDIFVAPSLSESFGLIYLEAMAQAKPVVAFHTGAVPEIVAHNETGLLVEPGNISELANALRSLADDAVMRQEMGRRGYERAKAKFSVQRMVEETVARYLAVSG